MSEALWTAPEGSPQFYPDAVTLAPAMTADAVLSGIDDRPGCSVKDSYADVELGNRGFAVLFEARWLAREPASPTSHLQLGWQTVATAEGFAEWLRAAGVEGILHPALMADATVRFLLAHGQQASVAGAAINETDGVIGVSNVFTAGIRPEVLWSDLPAVVGQIFGQAPLVGYEHGTAMSAALANDFVDIGALRVWLKPSA